MPVLGIVVGENVCSSGFLLFQKVTRGNGYEGILEYTGLDGIDGELTHGN
jgi:hypothetical protein